MVLIELPNGDWISPKAIAGVRVMVGDKLGPRVVIDTHHHYGHHLIEFDAPEAARTWAAEFGRKCAGAGQPEPPQSED